MLKIIIYSLKRIRKSDILILGTLAIFKTSLAFIIPLIQKDIVNIIQIGSVNILSKVLTVLIIGTGLQIVISIIYNYLYGIIQRKELYRFRNTIINDIFNVKYERLNVNDPNYLLQRVYSDSNNIFSFSIKSVSLLIEGIFPCLLAIFYITKVNYVLTIYIIITVILILLLYRVFKNKIFNLNMKQMELDARLYSRINESFQNIESIKVNSWYKFENDRTELIFRKSYMNYRILSIISSIFNSLILTLNLIVNSIILISSSYSIINGKMTLGELIALLSVSQFIIQPISMIINLINEYQVSLAAYVRVKELVDKPKCENGDLEINQIQSIKFNNVSFHLNNNIIINNLDLYFEKGKMYSIKGRNGIGKSTIAKLIMKLYDQYTGEICINNIDIRKIKNSKLHSLISFIEQKTTIINDTIENNILYGNKTDKLNISNEKLYKIYKSIKINSGIVLNNTNILNISGGEQQKIGILRGLLKESDVIILDEPTNSLDTETIVTLVDMINEIKANKIIIIVTHLNSEYLKLNIDEEIILS